MRWGLVGYHSTGPDPKRASFNARAESLEKSGLWRGPFHRHRCLIPASGFFEWFKPTKEAWRFTLKDDPKLIALKFIEHRVADRIACLVIGNFA
jgi:putative SOS response-associated peptidase YedK